MSRTTPPPGLGNHKRLLLSCCMGEKLITLHRHMASQQGLHPRATGDFTRLMWDLQIAFKLISRDVRRAGLADLLGSTDYENIHGERVMRLDAIAHNRIVHCMNHGGHLCAMVSEESDDCILIGPRHPKGKYVLVFDPLDGSSNIDVNVSIGTVFGIYRRRSAGGEGTLDDCLRCGHEQVAAGYVVYGSSTMLVYTSGQSVDGFTLDPSVGEFLLSHPDIRSPDRGRFYSINEGYATGFDDATKRYIEYIKAADPDSGRPYSGRYVGSLVADFHRNLMAGGIFIYPATPKPKMRLI
ncbi:MAG: fructose-1,6-bisphosphatase, partial [Verrucomicrobia bacterium]|nr:fructose-1,6-bisphosphatase [Verrucomicrobiota bacterium]